MRKTNSYRNFYLLSLVAAQSIAANIHKTGNIEHPD